MKKALILTWEKFQDVELLYCYHKLQEEFKVTVAANKTGYIYGVNGVKVNSDIKLEHVHHDFAKGYDLVVVVGGVLSVEYARQNIYFINTLKRFHEEGKVIASICHGAQYLIEADLTKGKRISGYYSIKKDIENSGAEFVDKAFVIDGNIITCPHYKYQSKWMQETVNLVNRNGTQQLNS